MVVQLTQRIGPIEIVSTCGGRHIRNSEHYRGRAVDFHPLRTSIAHAASVARSLPIVGGVGTYPSHVHADVGPQRVSWRNGARTHRVTFHGWHHRFAIRHASHYRHVVWRRS